VLGRIEGYVAALLGPQDAPGRARVARELESLDQSVLARADLRAVLSDTSIPGVARGRIVHDLLEGKVDDITLRIATYAAASAPAPEVAHTLSEVAQSALVLAETGEFEPSALALMAARSRVGGYADAVLEDLATEEFARVEEELFRWARTVDAAVELRRLLVDRDAPLASRRGTVEALLAGRVADATLRLALYTVEGGRARDVVGTLDYLVDYVARARDWRVARVYSARPLDEASARELVTSLSALTGFPVEIQVAEDPALLGGVLVEVGDLRLDATTRGRLGALHDAVASGHLFQSAISSND
jgi:F0F1-type ATP synthase delta subunit